MYCFEHSTYTISTIHKTDADYPKSLLSLKEDAPKALYCIGNISLLAYPKAAVLGSTQMNDMTVVKTDKMLRDISANYAVINMADEGIEYYSLSVAKSNHHKVVMLLTGTDNVDSPDYDDVKPMIDEVIKDGGLVISLYDDNADYIEQYYNQNKILVSLSDIIGCPEHSPKSCEVVNYAHKMNKEVIDY